MINRYIIFHKIASDFIERSYVCECNGDLKLNTFTADFIKSKQLMCLLRVSAFNKITGDFMKSEMCMRRATKAVFTVKGNWF